jgi:hypothetical protein
MGTYYLQLFDGAHALSSLPLESDGDAVAAAAATAVFQSCNDACDSFELRRNAQWVAGMTKHGIRHELLIEELSTQIQEQVVNLEELLLASRTKIAGSQRLLERTRQISRAIHGRGAKQS